jgi:hypothetical protein
MAPGAQDPHEGKWTCKPELVKATGGGGKVNTLHQRTIWCLDVHIVIQCPTAFETDVFLEVALLSASKLQPVH